MRGQELCIEKSIAADLEPPHQVAQRDFARVCHQAEHALAKECACDRHPVKTAHELAFEVTLNRMSMASLMEALIGLEDLIIDPRIVAASLRACAEDHDLEKALIDPDVEDVLLDDLSKRAGHMKGIERKNPSFLGLNPHQRVAIARLSHRKVAKSVSLQQ